MDTDRGSIQAPTPPAYHVIDLETVAGFATERRGRGRPRERQPVIASRALGINSGGQITGYYTTASQHNHAFFCTAEECRDLAINAMGMAIDDDGEIAGSFINAAGHTHAFLFVDGKRYDLGTLGGPHSVAYGVSRAGVTGVSEDGQQRRRAFLCRNRVMTDLGVPAAAPPGGVHGRWRHSEGRGINRVGAIAGSCRHFVIGAAAFDVDAAGYLGTLGGAESQAYAINEKGDITGRSDITGTDPSRGGASHVFLWRAGKMVDLGSLGGQRAEGLAINNRGQVVGQASLADGRAHAFVSHDRRLLDLNRLVPPTSTFTTLVAAHGINDRGQIVGYGIGDDGREHAFMMTPI